MDELILQYTTFPWQSTEHWGTLVKRGERVRTIQLRSSNEGTKVLRTRAKKLVLVFKNQELLNTTDRNLGKVSSRPKCDSCNAFFMKGCLPTVLKKV